MGEVKVRTRIRVRVRVFVKARVRVRIGVGGGLLSQQEVMFEGGILYASSAHLEQPRLELVVNHDVETVALETVLVVDHHVLTRLHSDCQSCRNVTN